MFSSYAISILILYLFNILPIDDCLIPSSSQFGIHSTSLGLPGNDSFVLPFPSISHPLHVLRAFLYIYSRFQWERYLILEILFILILLDSFVFSLDGPAIIKNGTFSNSSGDALSGNSPSPPLPTVNNLFKKIADQVRQSYNSQESIPKTTQTYRPYRFSLRYFNIVDPVDVTNNLGISVPLKNSKTIQTVLTNASQHMESLYAWWHQNCSRSSSHFPPSNPNPTPSMSAPRASYGTPLSIAPGLSSNPQTTLSPTATTMSPTTSILPIAAPISSFPASSPFLPPHATSCFHSQQQYSGNVYHPSHLPVVSQYHPAFQHPKSTEMSSSFLTAFFPQSLISYQSILQNQCVPRRSLPGSTNNLLEPDSEIKLTRRSSPPRKERSSSYTAFSTDQPSKDLSLVEEYDNLDSDIDLMWNSLKFVPSFSSRIPVLETQLSADKETDSPHTTSDNMNLSVDFNFEVEVESSEDPSDHEVLSPEQSSIDYPMKGSTPRPVENPEPFSPYPKNRLNDPVPLEPVKELTGPALSQHKSGSRDLSFNF